MCNDRTCQGVTWATRTSLDTGCVCTSKQCGTVREAIQMKILGAENAVSLPDTFQGFSFNSG